MSTTMGSILILKRRFLVPLRISLETHVLITWQLKIRLQQDAEAAQKIDSLRVSGNGASSSIAAENISEDDANLKSILKRKNDNHNEDENGAKDVPVETHSNENPPVPDYIRNRSRYTHYTFDSLGDVDEESNKQAYMEFLNLVRKSNSTEPQAEDVYVDLSKPLQQRIMKMFVQWRKKNRIQQWILSTTLRRRDQRRGP
ncbi:hypothetical protein PS1_041044 [Malus domestica]